VMCDRETVDAELRPASPRMSGRRR
jgi:hypothetical protein